MTESDNRPPLRVIFNDRVLFRPLTGVGYYARQLLTALASETDDVRVHPYLSARFNPPTTTTLGGARSQGALARLRARATTLLRPAIQAGLAWQFRRSTAGFDLYHEPNHAALWSDLPTVTTVHDLSVLLHPEWHPADRVRWYERDFSRGVRQTTRFIAASDFTRREMVRHLDIPADRIDVTYQAPRPTLAPATPDVTAEVRRRLDLPERFFLYVGTLEPRKNVRGLFESFAALPQHVRSTTPLVLVGGEGWRLEALGIDLDQLHVRDDVRWLGYLNEEATLAALYSSAVALVWPTLYEGFGLPPLEAMTCGCPVLVSDVASLPEVVGDVGHLLPPDDTAAWAAAMLRAAEDDAWRAGERARGLARARTFSWSRCARATIDCYRAALEAAED
jgi:glycosyltransferase involved in cell wall biosynthesis